MGRSSKQVYIDTVMNILIERIFNFRAQNRITGQKLVGFKSSEVNARIPKEFVALGCFSVDYEAIDSQLVLNIPNGVDKLEILGSIKMETNPSLIYPIGQIEVIKSLSRKGNPEDLSISGQYFKNMVDYGYFPRNVDSLTILYFPLTCCDTRGGPERLRLKS
ncbi:putative LRR containing protein [Trachipleistophora hominis]|uniref:Putative LRR containing protein n=1 Tax=Trachipleistophora hominis TaxID=72359 RepID=L7JYW0_TRAHO|nr:putative LRR containing protein [Trachipleistophora hominis]